MLDTEYEDESEEELSDPLSIVRTLLNLYMSANRICRTAGFEVLVGVFDLPRDVFDEIDDYDLDHDADEPEIPLGAVSENPLWVKRIVPSVAVYTREAPRES